MNEIEEILKYFPSNLYEYIKRSINNNANIIKTIQEIRIRAGKPIIFKFKSYDIVLKYVVTKEEILEILERLCENSIYAYKNQICQGFLTIRGGHRIGITGTVVIENGKVINVKYISSLNFRIAREILNCSTGILRQILDINNQTIYNTLIVSPPGKGKTTMLRDVVRQISNGINEYKFRGMTVGLIDERGEIAAAYKGIAQNDVGIRTDIIGNIDKSSGIEILIRTMTPEVIACDEIGTIEDVKAIKRCMISGVKGIFTMHGKSLEDIKRNVGINELIETKQIEKIIFI